jgi:sucrose-phosphate synthase
VGLPFVGTENGGPRDIKENCDSGLLVNVDDQEALTKALKTLLTQPQLWDEYSTNGINRVREHYTWEIHCRRYIDAVRSLAPEGPPELLDRPAESDAYGRRMASLQRMLITDIDNTLLGDPDSLAQLRTILSENREHLGFGVATGRYLESALEVLEENGLLGLTDLLITSVGTEIYYRAESIPDKGWASHLRAKWRRDRVLEALDPLPFLALQPDEKTQREFKVSYDLEETYPAEDALPAMHNALSRAKASYTLVFSHGAFIDVLPHRASKGKAIRYLSSKWSIPLARIATAGDSGNDTDMLRGATAGIAVANHSDEIDALRNGNARVYFANAGYAAGILEGLEHYGLLEHRKPGK